MLDDVFGSSSNPAVPGGSVTKPLMIALLALLASRYMSGGPKGSPSSGSSNAEPTEQDTYPTDVLGGLGGLLKQFQQGGFGDAINSWIGTGSNKPLSASQISNALGPEIIDTLSQRTGLPIEARNCQADGRRPSVAIPSVRPFLFRYRAMSAIGTKRTSLSEAATSASDAPSARGLLSVTAVIL